MIINGDVGINKELRITPENKHEAATLRETLDSIHWLYSPTYIYYVNGKRISGKEIKEEK